MCQPRSIAHDASSFIADDVDKNELRCSTSDVVRIANPNLPDSLDVVWSYSVLFSSSDIQWASRWDPYLKMQDPQIHWFSILNSFMIVLFLSGMVAMILMRALHKDLRRYVPTTLPSTNSIRIDTAHFLLCGWDFINFRKTIITTPCNCG